MPSNSIPCKLTDTWTLGDPGFPPIGSRFILQNRTNGNYGEQEWVAVYNDEAATAFAQGNVVIRDAATLTYDGILSTATVAAHRVLGVAQHAIAADKCGFILARGIGEVLADGNVTANSPIVSDTAGDATDMTAGVEHAVFGISSETDAGATKVTCHINCPG